MRSKIVSDGVPYKYCVYTPKTRLVKDAQYEHIVAADIRGFSNEYNNRYLKLASSQKGTKFVLFYFFYDLWTSPPGHSYKHPCEMYI